MRYNSIIGKACENGVATYSCGPGMLCAVYNCYSEMGHFNLQSSRQIIWHNCGRFGTNLIRWYHISVHEQSAMSSCLSFAPGWFIIMEGPDLNIVVPGVKVPLSGESAQRFIPFSLQHCSSDSPAPVRVIISVEGVRDTRIIDNVLTPSECAQLVTAIKRSDHLSFWNSDVSKKEMAKLFRDADTIEIESPEFADFIWKRIISVLDCPDIEIGTLQFEKYTSKYWQLLEPFFSSEDSSDPRWERELVGTWQPWSLNSDMLFARYKPGGHFAPHTDGRAIRGTSSSMSCVISYWFSSHVNRFQHSIVLFRYFIFKHYSYRWGRRH